MKAAIEPWPPQGAGVSGCTSSVNVTAYEKAAGSDILFRRLSFHCLGCLVKLL